MTDWFPYSINTWICIVGHPSGFGLPLGLGLGLGLESNPSRIALPSFQVAMMALEIVEKHPDQFNQEEVSDLRGP